MGLFSRKRKADDTPRETALVLESSTWGDRAQHGTYTNDRIESNELNAFGIGSIPHRLKLEVRPLSGTPFEVEGEFKVPAKATGSTGYTLPTDLELPVTIEGDKVEIDWKAFLDNPDRKRQVKNAVAREQSAAATAYTNSQPGMKEATWAAAEQTMPYMLEQVRTGKWKRKTFDEQVDQLNRLGQIDPELWASSKAALDAEGFV